ncbi:hypothetical protein F5Y19DRAFT_477778 [Xylariaceae sp. FL1651]|nr:hypothetical protein F5Y19DRAFT_477778 [Xylariaceae sp. FL1651]
MLLILSPCAEYTDHPVYVEEIGRPKILSTAYELTDGSNAWDEDQIMSCRTEDCVYGFWPSLVLDAAKGNNNAKARAHFLASKDSFKDFHVYIVEEVEDPAASFSSATPLRTRPRKIWF